GEGVGQVPVRVELAHRVGKKVGDEEVAGGVDGQGVGGRQSGEGGLGGAVRPEHAHRGAPLLGPVKVPPAVGGQGAGPVQPGEGGGGGTAATAIGADDGRVGAGGDVDVGAAQGDGVVAGVVRRHRRPAADR